MKLLEHIYIIINCQYTAKQYTGLFVDLFTLSLPSNVVQPSIIVMYKPFLKRPAHNALPTQKTTSTLPFHSSERVTNGSDQLMIASKLLQSPSKHFKDKKSVLTPLFAQSHPYPPRVAQLINLNPSPASKTIGAYKQINWISVGSKIEFWITGDKESTTQEFDDQLSCVCMGQLKGSTLPMRIRNHYILAVAAKNDVALYCLESFTLRLWGTGIRYNMEDSWQILHVQFLENNRLFIFANPNSLQLVEFADNPRIFQSFIPFYRRYLPSTFSHPNRTIENVLYSRNKIYILFQETKQKSWVANTINRLLADEESPAFYRFREVKVYVINESRIDYSYTISESDIKGKVKNFMEGLSDEVRISNIFIGNEKEEELGVVTTNGIVVSFRDVRKGYLVKDPSFLQNTVTYQNTPILSTVTSFNQFANPNFKTTVVSSLGFNDLTLTNDSLLWVGENSLDGVHVERIIAEMVLRRSNKSECFLFNSKEWGVFTEQAFYTIRKLPIRHYLVAIIFCSITQFDQYEPISCQTDIYVKTMQRIQTALTPQKMLKSLIEIIISGERYLTINNIVTQLICKQLRGEIHLNYRDWPHKLKPNIAKTQIHVSHQILCKAWNLILELQYKQGVKNKHICESNTYWMAVHEIYYELVSPLFRLHPSEFKTHKDMIENIFNTLKSLENFFQLKAQYESCVRKQAVSMKTGKEPVSEDLNQTNSSFMEVESTDITWVDEPVKKTICNKIMSENIIQVQVKLKKAVSLTINLMTIYFGLSHQDLRVPSFGDVLRSRADQQIIKRAIIISTDFSILLQIDSKIPELGLKRDIDFKSWANKMQIERLPVGSVDLEELSRVISSTYFADSLRLLANRYDLQVKALQMYEQVIIVQRDSLIQRNTLRQRSFISSSLFPEDQQTLLTFRRQYFNSQLQKILQEEKKCLREAVALVPQQGKASNEYSKMIDQLIQIAAGKPYLYEHLYNELTMAGNIQKISKLQKLKGRYYQRYSSNNTKINTQYRFAERELFPNP